MSGARDKGLSPYRFILVRSSRKIFSEYEPCCSEVAALDEPQPAKPANSAQRAQQLSWLKLVQGGQHKRRYLTVTGM